MDPVPTFAFTPKRPLPSQPINQSSLEDIYKEKLKDFPFPYVPFSEREMCGYPYCDSHRFRLQVAPDFLAWIRFSEIWYIRPEHLHNENDNEKMRLARRFYFANARGFAIVEKEREIYFSSRPKEEFDVVTQEMQKAFQAYEKQQKRERSWDHFFRVTLISEVKKTGPIFAICILALALCSNWDSLIKPNLQLLIEKIIHIKQGIFA